MIALLNLTADYADNADIFLVQKFCLPIRGIREIRGFNAFNRQIREVANESAFLRTRIIPTRLSKPIHTNETLNPYIWLMKTSR